MTLSDILSRPDLLEQLQYYRNIIKQSMSPFEAIIFLNLLVNMIVVETVLPNISVNEAIDTNIRVFIQVANFVKQVEGIR